jgi:undecaprenyl-diphosphatase
VDELLRALILGIVQGLTEFIPVSSSGHLILVPALFRWPDQGLAFDVGLHAGTLLAVLAYFRADWLRILRSLVADASRGVAAFGEHSPETRLFAMLVVASLPVAIVGFALRGWFEDNVREPWAVAVMLIVFGAALLAADRLPERRSDASKLPWGHALFVGVAQTFALIPGVSRSGVTISAARAAGLSRQESARFSFMLGTPAIAGGALLATADFLGASSQDLGELIVGFVTSAVVGWLAVAFLMRFLQSRSYASFVLYRWGVAVVTLAIAGLRVA